MWFTSWRAASRTARRENSPSWPWTLRGHLLTCLPAGRSSPAHGDTGTVRDRPVICGLTGHKPRPGIAKQRAGGRSQVPAMVRTWLLPPLKHHFLLVQSPQCLRNQNSCPAILSCILKTSGRSSSSICLWTVVYLWHVVGKRSVVVRWRGGVCCWSGTDSPKGTPITTNRNLWNRLRSDTPYSFWRIVV